jgi:hypothetical protein
MSVLSSLFSKNFIVVDANVSVGYAAGLASALRPEYLIVSRVKGVEHYRYVIHTEAFLEAMKAKKPDPSISLEEFLNLHEYYTDDILKVAGDLFTDPETLELVSKKTIGKTKDFLILDRNGQAIGLVDPQKGNPQAVYDLKGAEYAFQAIRRVATRAGIPRPPPPLVMAPKGDGEEEEAKFERYPNATFPTRMALEQTAPLEIIIRAVRPEPFAPGMSFTSRRGEQEVPVLIVVKPGSFELDGEYHNTTLVPVAAVDSKPVTFMLKAKKEGWQTAKVEFFQRGTYIGELEAKTLVVATETEAGAPQPRTTEAPWKLEEMPPDADLTLIIYEKKTAPEFEYEICLRSTKLGIPFDKTGLIRFIGNPETRFRAIFEDIERGGALANVTDDSLKAKGQTLYDELFPEELKTKYWVIHDKIKSVQVISDEPWIPWEIIRPWRRSNGGVEEDGFLCERYAFSRWLEGREFRRKDRVETAKLVVPSDTNLPKALDEQNWICDFARRVNMNVSTDSEYDKVLGSLRSGGFDLLHFSTHGRYDQTHPNLSGIMLEQGIELKPEFISGLATTFGRAKPLVVLNACQTGAQGFSLTGIGSWATRFLDAGASSFIGTLWSVSDETAFRFTQNLYQQLSAGAALGQAVQEARKRSQQPGDPSWLAYSLYGYPNSHVKLGRG